MNHQSKYDSVAMTLHWIIGMLMIFMIFFGENLMDGEGSTFLPSLHVSIGMTILVLSLDLMFYYTPVGTGKWQG